MSSIVLPKLSGASAALRRAAEARTRERTTEYVVVPICLLLAVLIVYHELAFSNGVPFAYDLFNYFYPHLSYAGERLRHLELPLWNPYIFTGAPFVANIQTAIFYPTTWLSVVMSPPNVVRYSALFHIWLAALGTYGFLRIHGGVSPIPAILSAFSFAFGGFVSSQFGHPNQLAAAAWLPVQLLAAGRIIERRDVAWSALLALAIGLQFLAGHTQEFFFSMVTLAGFCAWTLVWQPLARDLPAGTPALERLMLHIVSWIRAAVGLGLAGLVAALLMAPQLIPTLELSKLGIRGAGLTPEEASSFSWPPWQILRGVLPPFGESPYGEFIGYSGIVAIGFALYGVAHSRNRRLSTFCLIAVICALILAIGGFNPVYRDLIRVVPGLGLFRVPSRWLFIAGFGTAVLAGLGMDAALAARGFRLQAILLRAAPVTVLLLILSGVVGLIVPLQSLPSEEVINLWYIFGLVTFAAIVVAILGWFRQLSAAALVGIALAELFFAGSDLDGHRLTLPESYESLRPVPLQLMLDPSLFRVLTVSLAEYQPGDARDLGALLADTMPATRIDDLLIAHKYKDLLIPNQGLRFRVPTLDGYDGGVLPLRQYVEFKHVLFESAGLRERGGKLADPTQPDGLLREQLGGIPAAELLSLLNVKYVVMDRTDDVWVDGLYVDAGLGRTLRRTQPFQIEAHQIEATDIAIALQRESDTMTRTVPSVAIRVFYPGQQESTLTVGSAASGADIRFEEVPTNGSLVFGRIRLTSPRPITAIQFQVPDAAQSIVLAGVTLFDRRVGAVTPLMVDPAYKLVQLGDLKVYQNTRALERAFVAYDYRVVRTPTEAVETLRTNVLSRITLDRAPDFPAPSANPPAIHSAEIVSYTPERIRIRAEAKQPGLLVLTDSLYPGWRAFVDGREVPIVAADHAFRAVALDPGQHEVEFFYDPVALRLGLDLGVGGIGGLLALTAGAAMIGRRARRR